MRTDDVPAAFRALIKTSPEFENATGHLECPYCFGLDDGNEWQHTDECPWIIVATNSNSIPWTCSICNLPWEVHL